MSETVARTMSVAEFLEWEEEPDTQHELIDGVPVAMAPAAPQHMRICQNIGELIDRAVEASEPCRSIPQPGVPVRATDRATILIPDVVLTCEPEDTRPLIEEPRLIVEVLSRSTRSHDLRIKLPRYQSMPSVDEIWLVEGEARWVQVHERRESGWHERPPLIGQAVFASRVLGVEVTLDQAYRRTSLA